MAKLSSQISSEADLKEHIASYPELYEDLAVDVLEERLEMYTYACYIECFIEVGECDDKVEECPSNVCTCKVECLVNINNCDCDEDCSTNS